MPTPPAPGATAPTLSVDDARFIVRVMDSLTQWPGMLEPDVLVERKKLDELYERHGRWMEGSVHGRAEWLMDFLAARAAARPASWVSVKEHQPGNGCCVLTCWGNCAIGVSHREGDDWYASVQAAGPDGLAMNVKLSGPPSHWRPLPGSPRETWDGPHGDHPGWVTDFPPPPPAEEPARREGKQCETCEGDGEIETYPPGHLASSFLPTGDVVVNRDECPDCNGTGKRPAPASDAPPPATTDDSLRPMTREEAEREIADAPSVPMPEADVDAVMEYVRSGGTRGGLKAPATPEAAPATTPPAQGTGDAGTHVCGMNLTTTLRYLRELVASRELKKRRDVVRVIDNMLNAAAPAEVPRVTTADDGRGKGG